MSRFASIAGVFLLTALSASASPAERTAGSSTAPLSPSRLLSVPERYAEEEIVVRGVVTATKRDAFPNGRTYYTLSISDGSAAITVFSWKRPSVPPGESVEVTGTFHRSRFNIRDVVESRRITRLSGPAGLSPAPGHPKPDDRDR